jgi:uncharacterized protein (DUF39 family)
VAPAEASQLALNCVASMALAAWITGARSSIGPETAVTVAVAIAVPSSFEAMNTNPKSPAAPGVNESVLPAKE